MKYLRLLFLFVSVQAFSQTLSPETQVSLLTISPGEELYSTFGHSAIRINDPVNNIDVNYNYGTFDFNQPDFYIKFLRGYLDYLITSHPAYYEMEYWNYENRLITEQVLNLSQDQKQKVYDFLENNLKPENKEYRYKFFTDNCSTRLRDVLQEACGDDLKFDESFNGDTTFREWISQYAQDNGLDWADFGMSLAVGLDSDKETGWSDAMFLPDNLMLALDKAVIKTESGFQPVVLIKRDLNRITEIEKTSLVSPQYFFLALMLLVLVYTMYQYRFHKQSVLFDKIFFTIIGLAGWILLFLWFGTDHGVTRYNQNLIWASPLVFPAVFALKKWGGKLFMLYGLILILGIIYFLTLSSFRFSAEVVFICLTILFRLNFLFKIKAIGFK